MEYLGVLNVNVLGLPYVDSQFYWNW